MSIDRREKLLSLLAIEGQIAHDWQGMAADDVLYRVEGWEQDED